MSKYYILCAIFTLFGAFGALFFKKASTTNKGITDMIFNVNLYIGGVFYLIGAILNIVVLKYLKYTVVLPITSITYIWTMLISYFIIKEKITMKKIAGITCIILGAGLISL